MTGRRARFAGALILALLGALLVSASVSAQTRIGANLNRPANAGFDCTIFPPDFIVQPSGVNTCTYVGVSVSGESPQVPFPGGVVTRVRVRTSAPTGPMRVTVARALRTLTAGFACCFYAGQSQVFTPQANAISAVDVRLPVRNDINPEVGETVDYIGISVLAPGVAIPANGPQPAGNGSLAFFPHITPADSTTGRVDGFGNGALPLVNFDFAPLCGGLTAAQRETHETLVRRSRRARPGTPEADAPPAGISGTGGCLGGVTIAGGSRSGPRAILPMDCNLSTACNGKVVLTRGGGSKPRAAAAKKVGKGPLNIPSGQSADVAVKLRKAARKRKRLKVTATATVAGGPTETARLKLKR